MLDRLRDPAPILNTLAMPYGDRIAQHVSDNPPRDLHEECDRPYRHSCRRSLLGGHLGVW